MLSTATLLCLLVALVGLLFSLGAMFGRLFKKMSPIVSIVLFILGLVWLGFGLYFAIYFDAAESDVAESVATETTETKSPEQPEQQPTEVRDGAETTPSPSSSLPTESSTYERQQSTNAAWYLAHFQPLFDEQIEQWLEWTNRYWFSSWYAYDGSEMEILALQVSTQTFIDQLRAFDEQKEQLLETARKGMSGTGMESLNGTIEAFEQSRDLYVSIADDVLQAIERGTIDSKTLRNVEAATTLATKRWNTAIVHKRTLEKNWDIEPTLEAFEPEPFQWADSLAAPKE